MADTGKYYFASDLHLGLPDPDGKRERLFVDFLNGLPADAKGLFLLGDIFDFWVDYKDVVPDVYKRQAQDREGKRER